MKSIKKFQLWMNQHPNSVKIFFLVVITLLALTLLVRQNQIATDQNRQRIEAATLDSQERDRVLQKAIAVLKTLVKDSNDRGVRNTSLIICLLAAHGETQYITSEAEDECRKAIQDGVRSDMFSGKRAARAPTAIKTNGLPPLEKPEKPDNPEEPVDPPDSSITEEAVECVNAILNPFNSELGECLP